MFFKKATYESITKSISSLQTDLTNLVDNNLIKIESNKALIEKITVDSNMLHREADRCNYTALKLKHLLGE